MTKQPSAAAAGPVPNNEKTAPIHTANIAGGECHPAEMAAGGSVAMPIERPPINNVTGIVNRHEGPGVTFASTKRHPTVTECQFCGGPMIARRPNKRFCGAVCRRRAWLAVNPDKAAALADSDRARLRAHIEARGGVWVDRDAAAAAARSEK